MSVARGDTQIRSLLLDIEGTTTPIDFVYKVLFPYARKHLREYLKDHFQSSGVKADVEELRAEYLRDIQQELSPPSWKEEPHDFLLDSVTAYVQWLMDRDRKSTPLKSLQGKVWHAGYRSGELQGQLYPDVALAFKRWRSQGRRVCIFSSGSVLAQKLLFTHSTAGDLTPYIWNHFDTTVGSKKEAHSYGQIALALELKPSEILFVSDVVAELDAAAHGDMECAWCVRQDPRESERSVYKIVRTFDELFP